VSWLFELRAHLPTDTKELRPCDGCLWRARQRGVGVLGLLSHHVGGGWALVSSWGMSIWMTDTKVWPLCCWARLVFFLVWHLPCNLILLHYLKDSTIHSGHIPSKVIECSEDLFSNSSLLSTCLWGPGVQQQGLTESRASFASPVCLSHISSVSSTLQSVLLWMGIKESCKLPSSAFWDSKALLQELWSKSQ
jgi:hypothetical protein